MDQLVTQLRISASTATMCELTEYSFSIMPKISRKQLAKDMFAVAVAAADPTKLVSQHLPTEPKSNIHVVGAGKASASMAQAVETAWPNANISGLVITPYGTLTPTTKIELIEARHPVPDEQGLAASQKILELATQLGSEDTLLCLISGGGSALMSMPAGSVTLAEKQQINKALLSSGAAIDEMNCVRKHLSAIKGGRLAMAAYPARVITLAVSDVPGDDFSVIASGPTVKDNTTAAQALEILNRYKIEIPKNVAALLNQPESSTQNNDDVWTNTEAHMIATPQQSLEAAAALAKSHGYQPLILGDAIEGEARDVAKVMAAMTKQVCQYNQPVPAPVALVSGGETTVTLRNKGGRGGRNAEFLLSFANEIGNNPRVTALACDTDGIDGSEDNAGAIWDSSVATAAAAKELNSRTYLDNNDAYSFFEACDALVKTGPTFTNVNDFRVVLID